MKKITLIVAAALLGLSANAQYKYIVENDPSGDAGAMGVDVKNLSYALSSDKKNITFKFETHAAIMSWNYSGFMFFVDEDLDPSTGITPDCANKSMKADRAVTVMNMMGMWSISAQCTDASKNGTITGSVLTPDSKTALVTMPLDKVDADGDGKFNIIVGSAVAGSSTYIDDLPNTNYSKMDVLNTTGINDLATAKQSFNAYPNPAVNELNFTTATGINGTVNVYDITGRQVSSASFNGKNASVPVQQLGNGIYLFRVTGNDNSVIGDGRFSVQH